MAMSNGSRDTSSATARSYSMRQAGNGASLLDSAQRGGANGTRRPHPRHGAVVLDAPGGQRSVLARRRAAVLAAEPARRQRQAGNAERRDEIEEAGCTRILPALA